MEFLPYFILLGVCLVCRGVPLDNTAAVAEPQEADNVVEDAEHPREKRTIFPFVVGETILDIQCRRGFSTVCAPDGPCGCPQGYSSQTNVGVCGFATLNHFLNTSNIAGTCCFKLASSATTTTTKSSLLLPQIVAYPVYAQYPYAFGSSATTPGYSYNSASYGSSGYGKK